jgi:L,D-transpeptidase YcbB
MWSPLRMFTAIAVALLLSGCASKGFRSTNQYSHLLAQSNNVQVLRLYHAMGRYQRLETMAWAPIDSSHKIKPGERSEDMPMIRERLAALGDLNNAYQTTSDVYGPMMEYAVRHFQERHGLKADGVIGADTIAALNITPRQRLMEMGHSMQGWAALPSTPEDEYIQVNIPSFELNLVKNNMSLLHMRVVVGKPSWPTPTLESNITTVVLNPSWNVPSSIVHREFVHHMVKNPKYLEQQRIRIFEDWKKGAREIHPTEITWENYTGAKKLAYRFTQLPGADNVLGDVKFLFPNDHSVYLHDTQAKSLFSRERRDFSHGCIRLAQPMALFDFLMAHRGYVTPEDALMHLGATKSKYFSIQPMPLYITYMTAWVSPNGTLQFRKDIYHKVL